MIRMRTSITISATTITTINAINKPSPSPKNCKMQFNSARSQITLQLVIDLDLQNYFKGNIWTLIIIISYQMNKDK